MMTVYATSDLHGNLPQIPECDLLVLAGDYVPFDLDIKAQRHWFRTKFKDWLANTPARYRVGIAGNHDFALEDDPGLPNELPWYYLRDRGLIIEGISVYGTPWVPQYGNWAFMKNDDKLESIYAEIPEALDILVTHGPAFGVLDRSNTGDWCGSRALRERLFETLPDNHVFGHIHEAFGIAENAGMRSFNVSHCDGAMQPTRKPVYIPLRA